jgi:uncharacterized protein (TIGR02118 family)
MMKCLCALTRRPDVSRAEFQHYYEANHAPLAIKYYPFRRYVRNHLLDAEDIGFDTISEYWADDFAALGQLSNGPAGEIMQADERKFMDSSKVSPGAADEHLLSAGDSACPHGQRSAVLIDWSDGGDTTRDAVLAWGKSIAGASRGVSLDFVKSGQEPAFPARAVLWLPSSDALLRPPGSVSTRVLQVRRVETPAETLSFFAQESLSLSGIRKGRS